MHNLWWMANEGMKPWKLLCHIQIKQPVLKDKTLQFSGKKKHQLEGQKLSLRVTTSTNVSALKVSFLVTDNIARAKKLLGKNWFCLLWRTFAMNILDVVKKVANVLFSATTITRRIDEIADDIEA